MYKVTALNHQDKSGRYLRHTEDENLPGACPGAVAPAGAGPAASSRAAPGPRTAG